jgi:Fic family protein
MSAHFLSQFFRIHPFRDANGRVGRFFVQFFMHQCGYSIIFKKELHKKYFKALRYSHRKFDEKELRNLTYKSCTYTTFINKYLFHYLILCGSSTKINTTEELIDEQG